MPPTSRGWRPMDHFWDVTCPLLLWARGEDKAGREGGNILLACTPLSPGVALDPSPSSSPSAEGPGSGGAADSTVLPARPPPWEVQWHLSSCRKRGHKAGPGAFWLLHWAMARIWTDSCTAPPVTVPHTCPTQRPWGRGPGQPHFRYGSAPSPRAPF